MAAGRSTQIPVGIRNSSNGNTNSRRMAEWIETDSEDYRRPERPLCISLPNWRSIVAIREEKHNRPGCGKTIAVGSMDLNAIAGMILRFCGEWSETQVLILGNNNTRRWLRWCPSSMAIHSAAAPAGNCTSGSLQLLPRTAPSHCGGAAVVVVVDGGIMVQL